MHLSKVAKQAVITVCCLVSVVALVVVAVYLSGQPLITVVRHPTKVPDGWVWETYHTHDELIAFLTWVNDTYQDVAHVHSIGKSVQGQDLMVVELSGKQSPFPIWTKKPKVKVVGGIHGNEVANTELLLRLVHHLADGYGHDNRVTQLLDNTRQYILPSMNPDGRENNTRHNANDFDLNRNFPLDSMPYDAPGPASDQDSPTVQSWRQTGAGEVQPEVAAVIEWSRQHHFLLSASLHQGALVTNYPHDACDTQGVTRECPTMTDPLPLFMAKVYAENHPSMRENNKDMFVNGTVQGARWYTLLGGMQDWVFFDRKSLELTMETHEVFRPDPQELPSMWTANLPPLIRFMEMGQIGLHGRLVDAETFTPLQGWIEVVSPQHYRSTEITDENGEFFMMLAPEIIYCMAIHATNPHHSYFDIHLSVLRMGAHKLISGQGPRGLTERHVFMAERSGSKAATNSSSKQAGGQQELQQQQQQQHSRGAGSLLAPQQHHSDAASEGKGWQQGRKRVAPGAGPRRLQRQLQQAEQTLYIGDANAGMCPTYKRSKDSSGLPGRLQSL